MMIQINKVLVANRGEIAVRIFKTLHAMGITSVAVYSEADKLSLHASEADERYMLKGKELKDTYLDIDQMVQLARECHADAVHPGYGFLSENPLFVEAVKRAGMVFIGPGEEAIRLMGNKRESRMLARSLGIPVIEGATGPHDELKEQAAKIGFPLLVKAAAGGGGKGMRVVHSAGELDDILESTQREAKNYFGDGEVYIEKYLEGPRHIEVQLLGDQHGGIVSLFERECSLQRRHQKIIEEAPAPHLSQEMRQELMQAARKLASHIGYVSAGTVEFLVKDEAFYFLEMNTRIQVEHPVTEMITGIDMVKEQLNIAMGKALRFREEDLKIKGHALEARVYAEDPRNNFIPSPGRVLLHKQPADKNLRVDTALGEEGEISPLFDPMVSKVIVHANSRETARKQLVRHLKNYVLFGVKTNVPFLVRLICTEAFIEGQVHTATVEEMMHDQLIEQNADQNRELLAMAFLFANPAREFHRESIWHRLGQWRLLPSVDLLIDRETVKQSFIYHNASKMSVRRNGGESLFRLIEQKADTIRLDVDGHIHTLYYHARNGEMIIQHDGQVHELSPLRQIGRDTLRQINENPVLEGESTIRAPMHGKVVTVNVKAGDCLMKGDTILVLESMKMENKITATAKACVKAILVEAGDMVEDNSPLVQLTDQLP